TGRIRALPTASSVSPVLIWAPLSKELYHRRELCEESAAPELPVCGTSGYAPAERRLRSRRSTMERTPILALGTPDATLAVAGGKGANLAALVRAGFPVPRGFLVSTHAYSAFVEDNGLRDFAIESIAAVAT